MKEEITLEEIEEAFEKYFPKGESKDRGKAMVLIAYFKIYLKQIKNCQRCDLCHKHGLNEPIRIKK